MSNTAPAGGRDRSGSTVFRLRFDWEADIGTSLHKHRGWEVVLVLAGTVEAVVDGRQVRAGPGEYVDLPAGSVHAIWALQPSSFEVIGEAGLGLIMIVPADSGRQREVPIYSPEGPWAQDPPAGSAYTSEEEADRLRRLSLALLNR